MLEKSATFSPANRRAFAFAIFALALPAALFACGSSSTTPVPSSLSTGGAGAVTTVTFSCTLTSQDGESGSEMDVCFQSLVAEAEESESKLQCTAMQGVAGTGCATAGVTGCCKFGGDDSQEECAYNAAAASDAQGQCNITPGAVWTSAP